MQKERALPAYTRIVLFCLVLFAIVSCGQRSQHVGSYIAEIKDSQNQNETVLELRENGMGVWRVGDDEVAFSWYVKDGELRLNTRNGGVIVGIMDNGLVHVTIPGSRKLSFKKAN